MVGVCDTRGKAGAFEVVMKLSDKQALFTTCCITALFPYAHLLAMTSNPPMRVRLDYVRRCDDCRLGISNSLHRKRLAVDLLADRWSGSRWIWVDGHNQFWDRLGAFWTVYGEKHNIATRWGGNFRDARGRLVGDWGHFSIEHEGVQ